MYSLAHRILKNLNPETAHNLSIQGLKLGLYPKVNFKNTNVLEQTIWGRRFQTPIGLSAGFDKNAEVIKPILNMGFSFTELGTVTPLPQKGNLIFILVSITSSQRMGNKFYYKYF